MEYKNQGINLNTVYTRQKKEVYNKEEKRRALEVAVVESAYHEDIPPVIFQVNGTGVLAIDSSNTISYVAIEDMYKILDAAGKANAILRTANKEKESSKEKESTP